MLDIRGLDFGNFSLLNKLKMVKNRDNTIAKNTCDGSFDTE